MLRVILVDLNETLLGLDPEFARAIGQPAIRKTGSSSSSSCS